MLISHRDDNEKGMALLFALGILSALMVLGVAFVGSSLFYQNIAVNRRARSEAMVLARSAANRVAAAVMFYQDQLDDLPAGDIEGDPLPADYSAIFSVGKTGTNSSDHDEVGEFLRKYDVKDANNQTVSKSLLDVAERPAFSAEDSFDNNTLAQWIYVRKPTAQGSDEEKRSGEIIGRFAYQVLPQVSRGMMQYFSVLGGGINNKYFWKPKYPGGFYSDDDLIPRYSHPAWELRWGQNIDELNMGAISGNYFHNWSDASVNGGDIAANYADFYASTGGDVLFDESSKGKTALAKAWFEYWFIEGERPSQREAAPGNRRKFYLGPWDDESHPWYARFGTSYKEDADKRNSEDVVDLIASMPDVITDYDSESTTSGTTRYYYNRDDKIDAKDRGLPFFKRIAADQGSFKDIETRRRQIVANFNDYCDKDDIPTSDIPANDWNIEGTSEHTPSYTGNEKTYYINEIALAIQVDCQKDAQGNPFAVYVWQGIITELIDIYGIDYTTEPETPGETPTSRTDHYALEVGFEKFSADVYLTLEMKVKLKLKEGSDPALAPEKTITINPEVSYPNIHVEVPLSFTPIEFTVNTQKPYLVGNTSLDKISRPISAEELKTAVSMNPDITPELDLYEIDTIEIVSFSNFKIDNVKFQLRNLCLKKEISKDGDGNPVYINVDFVNVEKVDLEPTIAGDVKPLALDEFSATSYGDPVTRAYAFVGGMEVRDPRQNLNCKYSATGKASDWKFNLVLGKKLSEDTTKASINVGTLSSDDDLSKKIDGNLEGKCNSCSKPNSPEDMIASDFDDESKGDPAAFSVGDPNISTAVIRNAPMMSPWELGWIHRAAPFQTINLKRAGGWRKDDDSEPESESTANEKKYITWEKQLTVNSKNWEGKGIEYENGDGGILDWIKFTLNSRSFGKIDLNLFSEKELDKLKNIHYGDYTSNDTDFKLSDTDIENLQGQILQALFSDIKKETPAEFVEKAKITGATKSAGTSFADKGLDLLDEIKKDLKNQPKNRYKVRSQVLNLDKGDFWKKLDSPAGNDAAQEELIGKTINLLDVTTSPGNVFHAVIVAQTITDIGGEELTDDISGVIASDDPSKEGSATLGKFDVTRVGSDPNNNIHYDVITGEAKILVTYERDAITGMIRIRHIENIE